MDLHIPMMYGSTVDDPRVDSDPRAEIFARLAALEADVAALKGQPAACTAITVTPEELAAHDAKV